MALILLISFQTITSADRGFCDANPTNDSVFGSYQWPDTRVGNTSQLSCNFADLSSSLNATRRCESKGEWTNPNYGQCVDVTYEQFSQVSYCETCTYSVMALHII